MIYLVELCLIVVLVLMLLAWSMYCLCSHQGRDFHHRMILKTKNLARNIWFDLKKNVVEYLNVVYKLALFALAKSVSGHPDIWKVYWMISFATFAISCYCLKLVVERKRAQLTPKSQLLTPTNSEKVWFLTATDALEILFPLSYLRLAFFYFMELNPINHPMEKYGDTLAHATKIGIDVLAVVLIIISISEIRRKAKVEDQFVVDPSELVKGDAKNELPVVQKDVKNQSDTYASRPDVALQMDSGNQSVEADDVKRQDVAIKMHSFGIILLKSQLPEGVQKGVNYQEYAYVKRKDVAPAYSFRDVDPPRVPLHVDVEGQSIADANQPDVALQMNAENHSVADADPPEVAIQIADVENQPEMSLQMEVKNHSVADADRVAIQIDNVENQTEGAIYMDAENHSAACVCVATNIEYLVPAVSVYDDR
ncbi:hypothetical protein ACET3Z_030655 [Daucus carota]